MLKNGYIKLYRSLLNWEWYDDINTKTVFLHLLLTVSIADDQWHGITIPRGSRVSSYAVLASETKLSVDKVRTAIKHLETTGEITRYKHPKYTVFTVNNYDKFQNVPSILQDDSQSNPNEIPMSSQGNPNSIRKKEDKECKNLSILDGESKENLSTFQQSAQPPTLLEVQQYAEQKGIHTDVQKFYCYYSEREWKDKNGKPITNWKNTLEYWGKTEGTCQDKSKRKTQTYVSENAAAYESLINNLHPIWEDDDSDKA